MTEEYLSPRKFAQYMGCSHTAVVKAMERGRLSKSIKKTPSGNLIEKTLGKIEWGETTQVTKKRYTVKEDEEIVPISAKAKKAKAIKPSDIKTVGEAAESVIAKLSSSKKFIESDIDSDFDENNYDKNFAAIKSGDIDGSFPKLNASIAIKEYYASLLAEAKYKKEMGQLVDVNVVKKDNYEIYRRVREKLMSLPDRLAAEFAGLTDKELIHQKMTTEIRNTLIELANSNPADIRAAG